VYSSRAVLTYRPMCVYTQLSVPSIRQFPASKFRRFSGVKKFVKKNLTEFVFEPHIVLSRGVPDRSTASDPTV
jgi:hypothetical protein